MQRTKIIVVCVIIVVLTLGLTTVLYQRSVSSYKVESQSCQPVDAKAGPVTSSPFVTQYETGVTKNGCEYLKLTIDTSKITIGDVLSIIPAINDKAIPSNLTIVLTYEGQNHSQGFNGIWFQITIPAYSQKSGFGEYLKSGIIFTATPQIGNTGDLLYFTPVWVNQSTLLLYMCVAPPNNYVQIT
ncbi:MAG: hypothetical protein QXX17_02125 [Conexivisphaerales archaeon]